MDKTPGKEEKKNLDDLADSYHEDMAHLNTLTESLASVKRFAEDIDKLLITQGGYISANWDESTGYKKRMDSFSDRMLDKSAGLEFHIQFAKEVLNLVAIHRKTLGDPLRKINDELQKQPLEMKKQLNRLNTLIGEDKVKELTKSHTEIFETAAEFNKWYEATNELCLARRTQANFVLSQETWDEEIPKAVIEHKGNIDCELPRSFVGDIAKGAAECKIALEKEHKLEPQRQLLSERIFRKRSSQSDSDSDWLKSLPRGTRGVTIEEFEPLLKAVPKRMSPTELNQIINFASDQVGIWEAEYSFSPANSPNAAAKVESERWKELWGAWSDMLLKVVPDVWEQIRRRHGLIVAKHSVEKALHDTGNKYLQRLLSATVSKVAIKLSKCGFVSIAERLYAFSLYPKGSIGRSKV